MGGMISKPFTNEQDSYGGDGSSQFSNPRYPLSAPQTFHNILYDDSPFTQHMDDRRVKRADNNNSLDQVSSALKQAGLDSRNIIVGIDFSQSNKSTGLNSCCRKSLHDIGNGTNPYEQAISIIGKTFSASDKDNLISCYGFGDASTRDKDVFSFFPQDISCNGFVEVLSRYREIVPHLESSEPTSFAPIIEMAMTLVKRSGEQHHILMIISEGQMTGSVEPGPEYFYITSQEKLNSDVQTKASDYPLSIILVGVGDGPWYTMRNFDGYKNCQFVNFTKIMSKNTDLSTKETEFALAASMKMHTRYKPTLKACAVRDRFHNFVERFPLPPPLLSLPIKRSVTAGPSFYSYDNKICPICFNIPKDMAFGCGHQTCCDCGKRLKQCPICRSTIQIRIKLYS